MNTIRIIDWLHDYTTNILINERWDARKKQSTYILYIHNDSE